MRLSASVISYFRTAFKKEVPGATIYLYGSRTDDNAKGGDIDLMVLTEIPVNKKIVRTIRIEFYKEFGWQKVDIVNFTFSDRSAFKQLASIGAIEL